MILIQNGRVLDPVTNTDQVLDVLLDESGILKTGEHLEAEGADVIDASGSWWRRDLWMPMYISGIRG